MSKRPALTEDEKLFIKASGASINSGPRRKTRKKTRRPRFFVKTTVFFTCLILALVLLLSYAVNKAEPYYSLATSSTAQKIMDNGSSEQNSGSSVDQLSASMTMFSKAYELRGYGYTALIVLWLVFVGIMVFTYWVRSSRWHDRQRELKRRRRAKERKMERRRRELEDLEDDEEE